MNFITQSLGLYQEKNSGLLPEKILIFRDGVGGEKMTYTCQEIEVAEVVSYLNLFQQNYRPQILYCLIDKLSSLRLFMRSNNDVWNPGPGTVLDSALVHS